MTKAVWKEIRRRDGRIYAWWCYIGDMCRYSIHKHKKSGWVVLDGRTDKIVARGREVPTLKALVEVTTKLES